MHKLSFENVSFSYTGREALIENLSFEIISGGIYSITGQSGAGKSTCLKLMSTYLLPNKGMVLLDGKDIPKKGICPVQMLWQDPQSSFNPYLKILQSLSDAGGINECLMDMFGVDRLWLSRYPRELSGGQLQRIAIVRALTSKPLFVLADEISSMLDAYTQNEIWDRLLDYIKDNQIGLVYVSHSDLLHRKIGATSPVIRLR